MAEGSGGNLNLLFLVFAFFCMSLLAAVVLFKWLKSQAKVKSAIGQFGGAVAGFIGVYLLLFQSYQYLVQTRPPIRKLSLPSDYKQFVSEDFGFGFGYPQNLKLDPPPGMSFLGVIMLQQSDNINNNITIGVADLPNYDPNKQTEKQAMDDMMEGTKSGLTRIINGFQFVSWREVPIKGLPAKLIKGDVVSNSEKIKIVQLYIPNFKLRKMYVLGVTTDTAHAQENEDLLLAIASTVEELP